MENSQLMIKINPELEVDDQEDIADLTRQLRDRLLELNVDNVNYLKLEEIPKGAKSSDPITWGMLLVTLAASGGVITTIINTIMTWLKRNEERSVTLELNGNKLEVKGLSTVEQQKLIDTWLSQNREFLLSNE